MRVKQFSDGLTVHAIAGTYVVLLGFDLPREQCAGLLGFSIHRADHTENEAAYLQAMKTFAETDPGFPEGSHYTTRDHPIQSFQWADYSAKPGHSYTYTIIARKGTPAHLTNYAQVQVHVITESPETDNQDIYFNRGVAGSQAYVRRFGDLPPNKVVPPEPAYAWLSRGLKEAMDQFIRSCGPGDGLRIAAYEFYYDGVLDVVKEALDNGVDVQIVYDARKDNPKLKNVAAIQAKGLDGVSFGRSRPKSYISHNKFMVKLQGGLPISVWTGGTNFSEGGIYGHSNVAHVVEHPDIARRYLDYWTALSRDLNSGPMKDEVERISPLPQGEPPNGTIALFSPRRNLGALNWYADLAKAATDGLFMTFAFGMNDIFKDVYRNGMAPMRLALMEKKIRPMKAGPERDAEIAAIDALMAMPENVFAIGNFIRTDGIDGWVKERLTGLNSHVRFIHNKFMLVNPLTTDPVVIAGSANFSDASTRKNDENMVVIRGNLRVADIYLGEFMRLYTHHRFRGWLARQDPGNPPVMKPLRTDDWWASAFGNTHRATRRRYFARTQA